MQFSLFLFCTHLVLLQCPDKPVPHVDGVRKSPRSEGIFFAESPPACGPQVSPPPCVRVPAHQWTSTVSKTKSCTPFRVLTTSYMETCTDHAGCDPLGVSISLLTPIITPEFCILLLKGWPPHISFRINGAPASGHAHLSRGKCCGEVIFLTWETSWSNMVIEFNWFSKFDKCEVIINFNVVIVRVDNDFGYFHDLLPSLLNSVIMFSKDNLPFPMNMGRIRMQLVVYEAVTGGQHPLRMDQSSSAV